VVVEPINGPCSSLQTNDGMRCTCNDPPSEAASKASQQRSQPRSVSKAHRVRSSCLREYRRRLDPYVMFGICRFDYKTALATVEPIFVCCYRGAMLNVCEQACCMAHLVGAYNALPAYLQRPRPDVLQKSQCAIYIIGFAICAQIKVSSTL
jgi:hypothetical protein